jgi:hypothetical protein
VEKANKYENSSTLITVFSDLARDVLGEELRIETRREVVLVKEGSDGS